MSLTTSISNAKPKSDNPDRSTSLIPEIDRTPPPPRASTSAPTSTGGAPQPDLLTATLDDAAMRLIQLEPDDRPGFEQMRQMLVEILEKSRYSAEVKDSVRLALELLESFLSGSNPSGEEVLLAVSEPLEKALDRLDLDESRSRRQAPPDQPGRQAEIPPMLETAPRPAEFQSPEQESIPQALPADADPDLLAEFVAESREMLERAEVSLLALETDPDNTEAVNIIFRGFHTIKGTSAFLGLSVLSELAHCGESLLSRVRDKEIRCVGGYADLSLRAVDMLKRLVQGVQNALQGGPLVRAEGYDALKSQLRDPEAAGISAAPGSEGPVQAMPMNEPNGSEMALTPDQSIPGTSSDWAQAGSAFPGTSAEAGQGRTSKNPAPAPKTERQMDSSVRVSTRRLDSLIDTVGELVIAQSMVAQDKTVLDGTHYELLKKVTNAGKIVRELQDLSLSMRMVPLKATFQKMTRLVRDLAHKSGKSVNLIAEDRNTEIDRNMVDIINDLLVHMVRNAVDHGIEPPEVREKCGKQRTGTVFLSASHTGGNVLVEVRDDGKGLDREKIMAKAAAKGLVEAGRSMPDQDVFNLIFAPGFSTSDAVTHISGRGVGMDVVRKGVESLCGRIDIMSEAGRGSSFALRLPLTLAITDGMLVHVGAERYIIPTANIHLSFRPEPASLFTIPGHREMVVLRGEPMPLFRLSRIFDVTGAVEDPTRGLLVVVADGERRCALLADELRGQQQVVAKPLGQDLGKIPGISGAAILGDGHVGLILDPAEVVAIARGSGAAAAGESSYRQPAA